MMKMEPYRDLPPFTLNDVGIGYLVKLIPLLVSMTSSGAPPSFDNEKDKPVWWPEDIEWINPKIYLSRMQFSTRSRTAPKKNLELLRKVVLSCYEYHGVEALLTRLEDTPVSEPEADGEVEMEPEDIIQLGEDVGEDTMESTAESDGMVFVCCFCLEQFSSHEGVSKHQTSCEKGVLETTSKHSDTSQDSRGSEADQASQASSLPGNEDELFSSPEHVSEMSPQPALPSSSSSSSSSSVQVAPQHSEKSSPTPPPNKTSTERQVTTVSASAKSSSTTPAFVPLLKTRSQKRLEQIMDRHKSRQLMIKECREMKRYGIPEDGAWWTTRHRRKHTSVSHPDSYSTKELFALGLGLSEKVKADLMKDTASKKSQEVDLDCVIVGVEGPLSDRPCPESSPVLSPVGPSPRSQRSLMSQLSRSDGMGSCRRRVSFCFVEDEWADKEAMENGRDPLALSILSLPFSSPLGQRVKKYAKGEGTLNIIKDPELYCKTEGERECSGKLRFRASEYRISYRKKRRASNFVHKYKFNQEDRREFKLRMKTGLSAKARYLLSQMKEVRVKFNRLTKKEIKDWTEGKVITIEEKIYFDDDLCITHIDIPESKVGKQLASHPILGKHLAASNQPVTPQVHGSGVKPQTALSSQRHQALPPHVPNIFRNRTGYTASPPRVPPFPLRHSLLQDALHNSKVHPQQMSRPQFFPGGTPPSYGRQRPESSTHHRPGPVCSKPFVSSLGHSNYRPSLGSINNRRKQQMTNVRNDDGDASTSSFVFGAQNYAPIRSQLNCQGSTQSPIVSVSADVEQNKKAVSLTSLSNFDYFSIRDGVLREGHSLANTFAKNASALKRFQSKLLPLPCTSSPTNSQLVSSANHNSLSQGLSHSSLRNGVEHREHNAPDRKQAVMSSQVTLMNNSPHRQESSSGKKESLLQSQSGVMQKKRMVDDDDILEVICIDDD